MTGTVTRIGTVTRTRIPLKGEIFVIGDSVLQKFRPKQIFIFLKFFIRFLKQYKNYTCMYNF